MNEATRIPPQLSRYGTRLHGGYMHILVIIFTAVLSVALQHALSLSINTVMICPLPVLRRSEFVKFPAVLVEETLANMRDHLQTLQEIQLQLGVGHPDKAAELAETRLGMSSLGLHGAAEVSKYMPQGMQDAGTAMHRAASRFAMTAQDASVTGDLKPVFAGLAEITAQCVGCHAGYRLK